MERKKTAGGYKALAGEGEFEAVFAALNVKDLQGDVTLPGAFEKGAEVKIAAWGHDWNTPPVGKGAIDADEQEAWIRGRFFLETMAGRETYNVVKGLGSLQEWSYGYDILKSHPGQLDGQRVRFLDRLKVFEVSPVMVAAGVGTRTTAIKSFADLRRGLFASLTAELLELEGVGDQVRKPADVLKSILTIGGPVVVSTMIDDELMEIDFASLTDRLAVKRGAGGQTRRDVLAAEIASSNGGEHSERWIAAMLDATIDDMARSLVQRDVTLGGSVERARGVVDQVMRQRAA